MIEINDLPAELRPDWAESGEVTGAVWQTWFTGLPAEWREEIAERLIIRMRHDHAGMIDELRGETGRLSSQAMFAADSLVFGNDRVVVFLSAPTDPAMSMLDDREFAILRGLIALANQRVATESSRRRRGRNG